MKKLFFMLLAATAFVACNTERPTVEWIEGDRNPETIGLSGSELRHSESWRL